MGICTNAINAGSSFESMEAVRVAKRARSLFADAGSFLNEAHALRLLAELHELRGEFKEALGVAEKAQKIFHERGGDSAEAATQLLVARDAAQLVMQESVSGRCRGVQHSLDKAFRAANLAAKFARA